MKSNKFSKIPNLLFFLINIIIFSFIFFYELTFGNELIKLVYYKIQKYEFKIQIFMKIK